MNLIRLYKNLWNKLLLVMSIFTTCFSWLNVSFKLSRFLLNYFLFSQGVFFFQIFETISFHLLLSSMMLDNSPSSSLVGLVNLSRYVLLGCPTLCIHLMVSKRVCLQINLKNVLWCGFGTICVIWGGVLVLVKLQTTMQPPLKLKYFHRFLPQVIFWKWVSPKLFSLLLYEMSCLGKDLVVELWIKKLLTD